jgi:predicted aspartyl protease
METETVGRVETEATVENLGDLWAIERGMIPADRARRVIVPDALAGTGATLLSLPASLIRRLGLTQTGTKRIRSDTGFGEAAMYEAVRLTVQGRSCTMDVPEVPDGIPVLIGQIPLEHLDLVVDLRSRKLTGNPRQGGEHVYEMY